MIDMEDRWARVDANKEGLLGRDFSRPENS